MVNQPKKDIPMHEVIRKGPYCNKNETFHILSADPKGYSYYPIRVLKSYQIWDEFFVLAKRNEGIRSGAEAPGKQSSGLFSA